MSIPAAAATGLAAILQVLLSTAASAAPERKTGQPLDELHGVACVTSDDCWAVGSRPSDTPGRVQTTIQHWNGTSWSIVPSPNPSPELDNNLAAVTCNNTADCWAVGHSGAMPLLLRWNGATWTVVPPPPGLSNASLASISCTSSTACRAVGGISEAGTSRTLTLHWNGTSWTRVASPNPTAGHHWLVGISCTSANDCWAVGAGLQSQTLILRWDGSTWTIVPSPNPGFSPRSLTSVTCLSANDCWAAGTYRPEAKAQQALYLRWNGSSWVHVLSPPSFPESEYVTAITCTSATDCWSVGSLDGAEAAFAQRWDGTSWTHVPPAHPGSWHTFNSVACAAPDACVAVGTTNSGPLMQHWNGTNWTIASLLPQLASATSRKVHGSAGAFEIPLPLAGAPGIECRTGGASGEHQLVLTFDGPVTVNGKPQAQVTSGAGEVAGGGVVAVAGNVVTVPLTNVADAQRLRVTLYDVSDEVHTRDIAIQLATLLGDTNGSAVVNASDIGLTKSQSGAAATQKNFRTDVNASGTVNASDIGLVKVNSGRALP